ncbi:poly-gamma-glutamate hydrolase family protein [Streptomyces sp. RTd22]|uniref:poly-gamma-glutamate hydrolase family protein n=1 Tax=Streptomyces sp. RTd22 TaxID=1841249 RepID=UPI0007C564CD|nr:poly-gamma-glutamate hydrolase family protein [Streptomyces sp. RTd22]
MADTYSNYPDLAANKALGTDYLISSRIVSGARGAHIAIHGGAIEAPTTQLADYCASTSNNAFYSFQGLMSSGNTALHITSTRFDEPTVFRVLRAAEWTVAWHGASGTDPVTYLGGRDTELGDAIAQRLTAAGFTVSAAPQELDGNDPLNIANRNLRGQGVQLELSQSLRESFYLGGDLKIASIADASRRTDAFYTYASAVMAAIAETWPQGRPTSSSMLQPVADPSTVTSVAGYPGGGTVQMRMPFQLDAMGRVAVLTDPDKMLVQRSRAVVATVPGEYVGEPAFGSNISAALFRPSDPIAAAIINDAVRDAMARWEPDAVITGIRPVVNDDQEGIVDVEVDVALTTTPGTDVEQTESVHIMPGGHVVGGTL